MGERISGLSQEKIKLTPRLLTVVGNRNDVDTKLWVRSIKTALGDCGTLDETEADKLEKTLLPPDIVLVERQNIDHLHTLTKIRKLFPEAFVVLFSAHPTPGEVRGVLIKRESLGNRSLADDYLATSYETRKNTAHLEGIIRDKFRIT